MIRAPHATPQQALAAAIGGEVETWATVPDAPMYQVSDRGRVRSFRRTAKGRILRPYRCSGTGGTGHVAVTICRPGMRTQRRPIHQLVLEAFVGPRPAWATDVRHLNGIGDDNRLENLAYGTQSENARDSVLHGAHHLAARTHCKNGHEFTAESTAYVPGRGRQCLPCRRIYNARRVRRVVREAVSA